MATKIQFTTNFESIFKVELKHSYYKNGIAKDLRLVPTYATQEFLKQKRLSVVTTDQNAIIVFGNSSDLKNWYNAIKDDEAERTQFEQQKLVFRLESRNGYFFNFTDLADQDIEDETILYYHNKSEEKELIPQKLKAQGGRVELEITKAAIDNGIVLRDSFGEKIFNKALLKKELIKSFKKIEVEKPTKSEKPKPSVLVNIEPEIAGKYSLQIGDNEPKEFYVLESMKRPLGVVELYFGAALTEAIKKQVENKNNKEKISLRTYEIKFDARKTIWKYIIINNDKHNYKDFNIHTEDNTSVAFEVSEDSQLPLNSKVIKSNQPLPLQESPTTIWTLDMKHKNGKTKFQMTLPYPSPDIVKPDEDNSDIKYSEVYVYL